ncbi:MAG: hypothetical protein CME24_10425 [Gemmatimonadetes bacterium]|nr:hypothetical protein [Gemmatimonadota bacterium]
MAANTRGRPPRARRKFRGALPAESTGLEKVTLMRRGSEVIDAASVGVVDTTSGIWVRKLQSISPAA